MQTGVLTISVCEACVTPSQTLQSTTSVPPHQARRTPAFVDFHGCDGAHMRLSLLAVRTRLPHLTKPVIAK